jgi:hypothetical protein
MNFTKFVAAAAATLAFSAAHATTPASASAINLDFSGYAWGTTLSSLNGVSFSLAGGENDSGSPMTSDWIGSGELTNSNSAEYPTANILKFSFSQAVTDVSFNFDNEGYSASGRGHSYFQAFSAAGTLLDTVYYTGATSYTFGDTTGISSIEFNNGTGGTDSWIFGVESLRATAVPEPTETALFLAGLGLVATVARRKSKAAQA